MRRVLGNATMQVFVRVPTLASSALCRRFRRKARSGTSPAILVVRLDGLGDCIMTLPLLRQLRQRFPDAHLTVVTQPIAAELFRDLAGVDEVLVLRPAKVPGLPGRARMLLSALHLFRRSLRDRHFDIAINPRWDLDAYLGTFLCGLTRAPTTVGYEDDTSAAKRTLNSGFQTTWNVLLLAGPFQHEVDRNLAIGRALGCQDGDPQPELSVSPSDRDKARAWLSPNEDELVIGLGLPAAEARRRWTADSYLAMLRRIEESHRIRAVLFADDATAEQATTIQAQFPNACVAQLLPLPKVAAILSNCDVFIGSDSGLGHVAAAVGCRTVTLSCHALQGDPNSAQNPDRFRPYGPASVVVRPAANRIGCETGCQRQEPHCILDISPAVIAKTVVGLLGPLKNGTAAPRQPDPLLAAESSDCRGTTSKCPQTEQQKPWRLPTRDYFLLPLIAFMTIVCLLGIGEIAARLVYRQTDGPDTCRYDTSSGYRYRPFCTSRHKLWESPWITESYNACGYRSAEPCAPRPPGSLRVAVIGSSIARGAEVNYPDTFAARASAELSLRCGGLVDFQNLGTDSPDFSRLDQRVAEAVSLRPSAIVMMVTPYDLGHLAHQTGAGKLEPRPEQTNLRTLVRVVRESRIIEIMEADLYRDPVVQIRGFLLHGDDADYVHTPLNAVWRRRLLDFGDLLGRITAVSAPAHIPVLLFYVPIRAQVALAMQSINPPGIHPFALASVLTKTATERGVEFFDTTPAFKSMRDFQNLFYVVDGHPRAEGHAAIANVVEQALLAEPAFAKCATRSRSG